MLWLVSEIERGKLETNQAIVSAFKFSVGIQRRARPGSGLACLVLNFDVRFGLGCSFDRKSGWAFFLNRNHGLRGA